MTKSLRVVLAGGLAVLIASTIAMNGFAVGGAVSAAAEGSAVKKKGDSAFPNLEVTVAKTENLINEAVKVTWTGGTGTEPFGGYRRNFLQIMQCWGDDPSGPKPEQCQFGGTTFASDELGRAINTRQVVRGTEFPKDDLEPRKAPPGVPPADATVYVPFQPVTGNEVSGDQLGTKIYFDNTTTNEIPTARTRADGQGEELIEMQTATEAPGLGCGKVVKLASGKNGPRPCWLVVVPRSDKEVDGSTRTDDAATDPLRRLQTSPLMGSNWAHRIVFPLNFRAIPAPCGLGSSLVTVLGQENATEAISSWQPVLCDKLKTAFDYSEVPDSVARGKLSSPNPALSIFGAPPSASELPPGALVAPIAVSGLAIAYNLEVQTDERDPDAVRTRDGTPITGLKLNPRLVVKLLTQSYRGGSPDLTQQPENPLSLEKDPEFLALNPAMAELNRRPSNIITTVITGINPSDVNQLLWQWIGADAEAKSFIAGNDDGHGMKINPAYKGLDLGRDDYPKLDETCRPGPGATPPPPPLCTLDLFPYANTMNEAARSAFKGDALARTAYDGTAIPPSYKKPPVPQQKGQRAVIVVSDTAIAARLRLPMAALKNADGKYVEPATQSMLAAVAAWKKSKVANVLTPDPTARGANVYPLTNISYASVVPAGGTGLSAKDNAAARAAYIGFLQYALGAGQKVGADLGNLPEGYAPLSAALVKSGQSVVTALKNYQGPKASPTPKPQATPKPQTTPKPSGSGGGGTGLGNTDPTPTPAATEPTPVPTDTGALAPTPTPVPTTPNNTQITVTPVSGVGNGPRSSLLWVLGAGLAAGLAARMLPRLRTSVPPANRGGGAGA